MRKLTLHESGEIKCWTPRTYKIISGLLIISLFFKLLWTFRSTLWTINLNSWQYSEFLINFEGGFVRRGLVGQLLYEFYKFSGIQPQYIIIPTCIIAYASALCFFLRKFKEKNLCWWILISPFVFGYTSDIIRKDFLLCCLMILMLILVKNEHPGLGRRLIAIAIACLSIFIHEAFIFWGVPLFGLYLISRHGQRIVNLLLLSLPVASFILMSYYKGNIEVSHLIVDSWNNILPNKPIDNIDTSIGAIGWETIDTIKFHIRLNFSSGTSGMAFFVRPITMLCAYYLFTNFLFVFKGNNTGRTEFSTLFVCAIIFLSPMFLILSCDYGRLYQYATISTLAAFLIFNQAQITSMFPTRVLRLIDSANNYLTRFIIPSKGLMIVLLFLLAPSPAQFIPIGSLGNTLFIALMKPMIFIGKNLIYLL